MNRPATFDEAPTRMDTAVPEAVVEASGIEVLFQHVWMDDLPALLSHRSDQGWYPTGVPITIRSALAELAARILDGRASSWIIGTDHVVWVRWLPSGGPEEPKRAPGLAATIAWPDTSIPWRHALPGILARMPLAPPVPPERGAAVERADQIPDPLAGQTAPYPRPVDPRALGSLFAPGSADLAKAVYLGGAAHCLDPHDDRLPVVFARLLSWLPDRERTHPRSGTFADYEIPADISGSADRGLVNLFHYLTRAWFCPEEIRCRQPEFPLLAWQMVLDLSASLERSLPDLLRDLGAVVAAWDTADDLRHYLLENRILTYQQIDTCDRRAPRSLFVPGQVDAGWQWNRLLHYWGRSFLPLDEEDQLPRLAALLAQRIAVDHLFHLDAPERHASPRRYLRRLMYEALLPSENVAGMLRALTRYLPSLIRHPEVPFG